LDNDARYLYSLLCYIFLYSDSSPQDTPPQSSSTSIWVRPSFLYSSMDREDLGSRFNGPLVSLFIPPWLLVSLPSCELTTTVPKGVSLSLKVEPITRSDENDVRGHSDLNIWTRRFRQSADIQLLGVDDARRLLPQSKGPYYQLSVIENGPDCERAVLRGLRGYLGANSQV
jgi:hypothetical protein